MASSHGLTLRLLSLVIHPGQEKNSLPKNRILFSDLGNISEIANSLDPKVTSIKLELGHISDDGGIWPKQKTREELLDRIGELEAENVFGVGKESQQFRSGPHSGMPAYAPGSRMSHHTL